MTMPASRRAPAGVPPPLLPSASWHTSPKHVWTVPPHWHWSLPPDPARKICHRVVVPERTIRDQPSSPSFPANTSAHTALPRHAEGFGPSPSSPHPPEPQALLFPLSPARAASSPQLLVKAPPRAGRFCVVAAAPIWFCSSCLGTAGLPSKSAFARRKDREENNLPSLKPKRKVFL